LVLVYAALSIQWIKAMSIPVLKVLYLMNPD
jgi:hypothetical protein